MAWQKVSYQLTSEAPLILHNGQTADPTNKWAKAKKQVSSKRTKTDADYEEMARIEFLAALYMDEHGPIVPAPNIEAMLINAAKKSKEGQIAKSGMIAVSHMSIQYDGPRTADELWADERFRFTSIVRISMSRVATTRPIFNEWSGVVQLQYENTQTNVARLDDWMQVAGSIVGVGDWRPQHGRFSATRINGK